MPLFAPTELSSQTHWYVRCICVHVRYLECSLSFHTRFRWCVQCFCLDGKDLEDWSILHPHSSFHLCGKGKCVWRCSCCCVWQIQRTFRSARLHLCCQAKEMIYVVGLHLFWCQLLGGERLSILIFWIYMSCALSDFFVTPAVCWVAAAWQKAHQ